MIAYVDASVLVPLIVRDSHNSRAIDLLAHHTPALLVSDFTMAEFASVVGRRVRTKELTADAALKSFAALDIWLARRTTRIETVGADMVAATALLRRLDLGLRAPDAINAAIAQRCNAALATFDAKLASAARQLAMVVLS